MALISAVGLKIKLFFKSSKVVGLSWFIISNIFGTVYPIMKPSSHGLGLNNCCVGGK